VAGLGGANDVNLNCNGGVADTLDGPVAAGTRTIRSLVAVLVLEDIHAIAAGPPKGSLGVVDDLSRSSSNGGGGGAVRC
jgi:hypothetical protein